MYKYEMHLHTFPCSACGRQTIEEAVDAAKAAGYSGFVVTNHFFRGNTGISRHMPWTDFVRAYEQDYLRGRAYGQTKDIDVLFGIESGYRQGREVLVYGLSPDDVKQMPEFMEAPIEELSASIHRHGGLMYYAHPLRLRHYIPDPDVEPDPALCDGAEVFNCGNKAERDELGLAYAVKNHLPQLSGGDVHGVEQFGQAGIETDRRIRTSEDLLEVLQSGAYQLIRGERYV